MATEAQRLMMVSIGKIQGCRQQKGGLNLYKSLLVTKVLFRARSVVFTENAAQKDEETEDQRVPEIVMQHEDESHVEEPEHDSQDNINNMGHNYDFDSQDKENMKPVNTSKPQNHPVSGAEDFPVSEEHQTFDKCARRAKRRLTEVEQAVESISPKKQRLEEYDSNKDYSEPEQPMQVEQISSLVNRFSSGFTGLLASDSDHVSDNDDFDNDVHEEECDEVQGHSSDSSGLLSCSTQIKESFELLARPIALSV
jgi:hypothetical protein